MGHVLEHHLEGLPAEADRSRVAHVPGRGIVVPFRHQLDDGGDERGPEPPCDCLGGGPEHEVVFPGDHVGAVLLDAAGGHDRGGGASGDPVADLHPGQLLDEDAVPRGDGAFGVQRVPRVVGGRAASGADGHDEGSSEPDAAANPRSFAHPSPDLLMERRSPERHRDP